MMASDEPGGLNHENVARHFYDERYAQGYMDEWPREKRRRVYEMIGELGLPSEGEALDFGCGCGIFTQVIREALPGWRVAGTDLSAVALDHALMTVPGCEFIDMPDVWAKSARFDFLFTHHVIEHVYDLDKVWRRITNLMKPSSAMLHILPCGNPGSLEYRLSRMVTGGFDSITKTMFFEEEGHLRRLDTVQMRKLAASAGFSLSREYYSNQHYGTLDWMTTSGPGFVLSVTETAQANDDKAARTLVRLRRLLLPAAILRRLKDPVRSFRGEAIRGAKRWAWLLTGLVAYPAARLIDWHLIRKSEAEWRQRKHDPAGSEMYLYFRRKSDPAGG